MGEYMNHHHFVYNMNQSSNRIIQFNKSVKWRIEEGHILLCDCKTVDFYQLPLQYTSLIEKLNEGTAESELPSDLKEDLFLAEIAHYINT
jgi:hypothetical protein